MATVQTREIWAVGEVEWGSFDEGPLGDSSSGRCGLTKRSVAHFESRVSCHVSGNNASSAVAVAYATCESVKAVARGDSANSHKLPQAPPPTHPRENITT